jgi:phage-related baseplate assembly protein
MTMPAIDLSLLPAPNVVEVIDYEIILATRKAMLISLYPESQQAEIAATLELESEPQLINLQENAYREVLLRQRINDAARAVMLAYAQGEDLDQIGANLGVARLLITPQDDTTVPPTAAVYELDKAFLRRILLSFQAYTTAGSEGSYQYHGLSASGKVKDISAVSPAPVQVMIYVLSMDGNGEASDELIATVKDALNAQDVRPLTDLVSVQSASVIDYQIVAELVIYEGPDGDTVLNAAKSAAQAYADSVHSNGLTVGLSGIYKALHQAGVDHANLTAPATDLTMSKGQAAYCTNIAIRITVLNND